MASIVVKTPKHTWTAKQGVLFNDVIQKEIEKNASKVALNKLAELNSKGTNYNAVIEQRLAIYATFFQRVVSRTPLDEKYTWYELNEKTVRMNKHTHKPDKGAHSQCRYDWFITGGGKTVTAKDFPQKLFDTVNDRAAIDKIQKKLKTTFASRISKKNYQKAIETIEHLEIKNDNPHFAVLEYGGGYRWKNGGIIKSGPKYQHGVENLHSVQAPVGMYRITEMELQRESEKASRTNLTKRYKGNGKTAKTTVEKVPSDKELEDFWKILRKGKIVYKDIKRYVGE